MPYIQVAGLRTYYEVEGTGRDVLLIHGAGQDTVSWRFVLPRLSQVGRVWAVDLPGHGKSVLPMQGPIDDLVEYANFLLAALDVLSIASVTLVGHSMSAGVALIMALRAPTRVQQVVCIDGGGETNQTHGGDLLDLVAVNPADYFEVNFRVICSPSTAADRVDEIAWDVTRCNPLVVYNDIRAYAKLSMDDKVPMLRCPVTFIHGADDWSIPVDIARRTAARVVSGSSVHVLSRTGHFPHVENPQEFTRVLVQSLGGIG